jgi:hypothetical protein
MLLCVFTLRYELYVYFEGVYGILRFLTLPHIPCSQRRESGTIRIVYGSGSKPIDFCGPLLNHYWKPRTPKPFLRFEPQNNTQKIHKQYTTNKYTNYEIFYLIHRRKNIQKSEF